MPVQQPEPIDHTVQVTHEWVNELRERLGWTSRRDAMHLMRSVLTELRDRLPHAEVAALAVRMPLLVRGMYYEGWRPSETPILDRTPDGFERAVAQRLGRVNAYRGHADIAAVFAMLANRITTGELSRAKRASPPAVRDLWPNEPGGS